MKASEIQFNVELRITARPMADNISEESQKDIDTINQNLWTLCRETERHILKKIMSYYSAHMFGNHPVKDFEERFKDFSENLKQQCANDMKEEMAKERTENWNKAKESAWNFYTNMGGR